MEFLAVADVVAGGPRVLVAEPVLEVEGVNALLAGPGTGRGRACDGGTFSPTVPGPVDSADTFNGQGGPRSRSKPLQKKEFRTTYCLSVHC